MKEMLKMKKKAGKVVIYIRDEITGIDWITEVDKLEFEQCVERKKELGFSDPTTEIMLDYALFDNCAILNGEL